MRLRLMESNGRLVYNNRYIAFDPTQRYLPHSNDTLQVDSRNSSKRLEPDVQGNHPTLLEIIVGHSCRE